MWYIVHSSIYGNLCKKKEGMSVMRAWEEKWEKHVEVHFYVVQLIINLPSFHLIAQSLRTNFYNTTHANLTNLVEKKWHQEKYQKANY